MTLYILLNQSKDFPKTIKIQILFWYELSPDINLMENFCEKQSSLRCVQEHSETKTLIFNRLIILGQVGTLIVEKSFHSMIDRIKKEKNNKIYE